MDSRPNERPAPSPNDKTRPKHDEAPVTEQGQTDEQPLGVDTLEDRIAPAKVFF